jgi:hypothetical protein
MKSWNIGIMEYWSDGFNFQYSNIPVLQFGGVSS